MKIGSQSSPAADAAALARANSEAGAAAVKARGPQEAVASSVRLSSTASGLLAEAASPEFDAGKVERMKQAIANGSFKVNAQEIADKMIANAAELLSAAQRKS